MRSSPVYQERLLPSPAASVVLLALVAMFSIAVGAPLGVVAGWIAFAVLAVITVTMIWWTTPRIVVTNETLTVGVATLPRSVIVDVTPLDAVAARTARGPDADARTYLELRPWATGSAVLVRLSDERDPHPAWLFSSRHPDAVTRALQ